MNLSERARSYVSDVLHGMDVSDVPDEAIRACVDQHYLGGWDGFVKFWTEPIPIKTKVLTDADHYRAFVSIMPYRDRQKYRLGMHDEVLAFGESTDDEAGTQTIMAMVRVAEVEHRTRRDAITSTKTRVVTMVTFVETGVVKVESFESNDPEPLIPDFIRWGRVRTADRVESDEWQAEYCFRPGTHRTPMDNAIRRQELSWKDVYGDEGFQDPELND